MRPPQRRMIGCLKCVALCLSAVTLGGCNRVQTEQEAVEQYYKNNPGAAATRVSVAKVAGRVSIDGQPPAQDLRLFVVLSDPEHLEKQGEAPRVFAQCDPQGNFAFTTNFSGDGVAYGKYVLSFVELHRQHMPRGVGMPALHHNFVGPDALNNLYNDPETNKNDSALLVDVQPPGRTDYQFDLSIAGKDPVTKPGPHAVTWVKL